MSTSDVIKLVGGARNARNTIRTTMYVMLNVPQSYNRDLKNLIHEFKYRHYQIEEHFNYKRPDVKHMTLLKVDLLLTPYIVNKVVKGTRLGKHSKNKDFFKTLTKSRGEKRDDLWYLFSEILEIRLEKQISKDLAQVFKGLPKDTTASCYHSRFNLFGDFAVIQYKPDLGFFRTILPTVKKSVNNFFDTQVKAGEYYAHPRNILLHISFARLHERRNNIRDLNKLKSDHRDNWLGPEVAKNFVINRDHLLEDDAIMVSIGRPQFY